MPRSRWPVTTGLLLCTVLGAAIARAGESQPTTPTGPIMNYLFCTGIEPARELADESRTEPAIYYSAPFVTEGANLNPVYEAFFQFLKAKYGYTGGQSAGMEQQCYGLHSLDEAATSEQTYITKSREHSQKVIETGWTFTATPSAAPPQPAQAWNSGGRAHN